MLKISFLHTYPDLKRIAEKTALELNGYVVPDYEEEYRKMVNRPLTELDYYRIAKGMLTKESEYEKSSKNFLIALNNPFLIYRKSKNELGKVHPKFPGLLQEIRYHYLFSETEETEFTNQNILTTKKMNDNYLKNFIKEKIQ